MAVRAVNNLSRSAIRICGVVALVLFVNSLAFMMPFYILSTTNDFNLGKGVTRESKRIFGITYRKGAERETPISVHCDANRRKDGIWIVTRQDGFLFPFDMWGMDLNLTLRFADVERDIPCLARYWSAHGIDFLVRKEQAEEYMRILRNGKPKAAHQYVVRILTGRKDHVSTNEAPDIR